MSIKASANMDFGQRRLQLLYSGAEDFMIPVTLEGLKAVAGWIGSLGNWKDAKDQKKRDQTKASLESLMTAVRETRQYVASLRLSPTNKNLDTQSRISKLWSDAGVAMLPINNEIANLYLIKADYWSDPEGWTASQKDEVRIQLDEVFRLGREALLKQPVKH